MLEETISNLNQKIKNVSQENKGLKEKVEKYQEESNTTFTRVNLVEIPVMVDSNYASSSIIVGLNEIIDYIKFQSKNIMLRAIYIAAKKKIYNM